MHLLPPHTHAYEGVQRRVYGGVAPGGGSDLRARPHVSQWLASSDDPRFFGGQFSHVCVLSVYNMKTLEDEKKTFILLDEYFSIKTLTY